MTLHPVQHSTVIIEGAMKAHGVEGKESSLEENRFDSGQNCEEDGQEELFIPECRIVVPPPSHVMCERALQLEKKREDTLQWNPETRKLLDRILNDVYMILQPTKEEQNARRSVIQFVDTFVKQKFHGGYVQVFGSFVMDLYTGSSDLDLSLNVGYSPVERTRGDKIAILRKLTRALHGFQNGRNGLTRHTVRKIEPVMRAAVPVVKFVEGYSNIECDVSMENTDGVLKSELLGLFTLIDPRFRQLCYLLKAWAKAHNVNDSKKGTLNSLSIILLAAFHLQTRSPPILPSFSALLEGLVLQGTENCIAAVEERVALHVKNGFGRDNKETLSQLFGSFFIKLVAVENLWEQGLCASVFESKWISKVWEKNHFGCMSVEDFSERSQNCARAVREKEFDIIQQSFRDTLSQLNLFTGSASQISEIKHALFGMQSLKRPSEQPLVQPVEKQLRVSNGWMNSAPYGNPDRATGLDYYGIAHPHRAAYSNHNRDMMTFPRQPEHPPPAVYFNHNRDMMFTGQPGNAFQGYPGYSGWVVQGENFRPAGGGILSPFPGDQVRHFAGPGHDHMRYRTGS